MFFHIFLSFSVRYSRFFLTGDGSSSRSSKSSSRGGSSSSSSRGREEGDTGRKETEEEQQQEGEGGDRSTLDLVQFRMEKNAFKGLQRPRIFLSFSIFFPKFRFVLPWVQNLIILEVGFGFSVKNCIFSQLETSGGPQAGL